MGVYKSYAEVSDRHKLTNFQDEFAGTDTWNEFVDAKRVENCGFSEDREWKYDRCGSAWKDYMAKEGRHHALADPEHVERFLEVLDADYSLATVHTVYFGPLAGLYEWLFYHADFEHYYSPVLFAAANDGVTRKYWTYRRGKGGDE